MKVILLALLLIHFADRPDLTDWAATLRSNNGLCCSFADAESLTDIQVETKDGHYRVFLDGRWFNVPDSAILTVPNRYGSPVVWPMRYPEHGAVYDIRCFLPGAGT